MTKEQQAIEILEQVREILINSNSWLENTHEPLNQAFDMAFKALEQQPSEDCVSRADVFQMIKDIQGAGDYAIGYYTYDRVKNLPPVVPAFKVPREDITEDEVRINMLELALNQAKEHAESIEVLTDNHRLIFKAENEVLKMINEFAARVLLENNIRLRIRAINEQEGDRSIKYRGAIETLQEVLEYDDFTIDCITDSIRRQEEKRGKLQ